MPSKQQKGQCARKVFLGDVDCPSDFVRYNVRDNLGASSQVCDDCISEVMEQDTAVAHSFIEFTES